jgi:hypothetical protein
MIAISHLTQTGTDMFEDRPHRPRVDRDTFFRSASPGLVGDPTVDEVAGVRTVPAGTARSDLTRARAALATLLED